MKVIITEKPSVAREIGAALNITKKEDGYLTSDNYCITWAFGHLIELCPPEDYGWGGKWTADLLPMIPDTFKIRPKHKYDSVKKSSIIDDGVQKQLDIIKILFSKAESIIVATDAGREGELIFRYIYQFTNTNKPFSRLWLNSMTHQAITKAFVDLKPGENYRNLFFSAKCRSEADWLVGMNASRALTIAAANGVFSLGRVQTPTLAILCKRFIENRHFVPKPYYRVKLHLSKNDISFTAQSPVLDEKSMAENLLKKIEPASTATVTSIEKKLITEQPPLLHDLTSLQREANKIYGISADDTLNTAQALYEKQFITYPRTGSCYIPEDVFITIPSLIDTVSSSTQFGIFAAKLKTIGELNKKSVNDNKVTDHHALLITNNLPGNLTGLQEKIYCLIMLRFLKAFYPPSVKLTTSVTVDCSCEMFNASGSIMQVEGWRTLTIKDETASDSESEDDKQQTLPDLVQGDIVNKGKAELGSKMTKPKPILTEDLLLGAMETCGKEIDDEILREAIKECGIGTPATRASIVETLLYRNYIERQKKLLIPTPRGLAIYDLLKDKLIASAELTGLWEKRLNSISLGVADSESFMIDANKYTTQIVSEILAFGDQLKDADLSKTNAAKITCPKCKSGHLIKGEKNHYCSDYKKDCDFKIWHLIAKKTLTEKQIVEIVSKGKSRMVKGFIGKSGKPFDAKLVLTNDYKLSFEFPNS